MRARLMMAGLAAMLVALVPMPASADSYSIFGLWGKDHTASVTDCGQYLRDANNFCNATETHEPVPVELGVKFQTSKPLLVSGVRVYRTDADPVTGSLWSSSGTRLATGTFAPYVGHGWQDLTFSRPAVIWPGRTYVASYQSPNANYAFEYDYFSKPHTAGPITALQSVEGNGNGVFCYFDCFPSDTFRNSNYWVTPLWLDLVQTTDDDSDDDGSDDDESDDDD